MVATQALERVRASEEAWNARCLDTLVMAHAVGCQWRCRSDFLWGREQVRAFVGRRWRRELEARMQEELWTAEENRLSTRFACEYRDDSGTWYRAYGNENRLYDNKGLVILRHTCVNEHVIAEYERKLRWKDGARPPGLPSLAELGF